MSDKNGNNGKIEDPANDAGRESAPETAAGAPSVEELVPGLEAALGAEAVASGVIARLEADCYELKDKLLRALAESENIRRRAERDRKDAETYGGTKLARDLLAVHDNLDRALAAADDTVRKEANGFIEGVELTQRELLNAFAKHKIEKINPAMGEKFDPNRHQAMFEAPIPGTKPGTVIEVMQSGFAIADRLLRPALVGVAKSAPAPASDAPSDETPPAGPADLASGESDTD